MTLLSPRPHLLSEDAKAKLRQVSTATLTSQLGKHGLRNTFLAGLYPLRPELRLAGNAPSPCASFRPGKTWPMNSTTTPKTSSGWLWKQSARRMCW